MLLTIAGQTAGSKWLNFLREPKDICFINFFSKLDFLKCHGQRK